MLLSCFLPFLSIVAAKLTVSGSLQLTDFLTSPLSLPPTTRVLLTDSDHTYSTPILTSGLFHFHNVEDGSYLLTVSCQTHGFRNLRIDVHALNLLNADESVDEIKVFKTTPGAKWSDFGPRQTYPIILTPTVQYQHLETRPSFDPIRMVTKNPLILIGLTMAIAVFGMPALMKLVDPEGVEEMERIKRERAEEAKSKAREGPVATIDNPVEKLQNFELSGWLAGKK